MRIIPHALASVVLGLFFATAQAAPFCQVDPSRPKFYRLELTVPAAFCSPSSDDPSCQGFPKAELIQLHGLWPNYDRGYPEGDCSPSECRELKFSSGRYCGYPEMPEVYASRSWKDLKPYMAGVEKCLERHEWVKHGTCSPLTAAQYFDWSLRKTREIVDKLALPADRPIAQDSFNGSVARNLPELNGAFNLKCRGNRLVSLHVLYEWGKEGPGRPLRNDSGRNRISCPYKFVVPSRPN